MTLSPLTTTRLLAVMPHPDDEAWAAGATLALAAARGADVRLLCLTRGEAGGDPVVRSAELAAACAALGLPSPVFGDRPDGALSTLDDDAESAALGRRLAALGPEVVLGLGADGGYGHRDHLAAHRWLRRAVAALPSASRPALFELATPAGHFHRLWRAMRRFAPALVEPGWGPERFGGQPRDVVVPVGPALDAKRAAVAAHASQLRGAAVEDFLMPGLLEPLWHEEAWTAV